MPGTAEATSAFNIEGIRELSKQRGEPAFLLERRLKAFEAWNTLPMPGRTDEIWRRVKLDGLNIEAATARFDGTPYAKLHANTQGAKSGVFWGLTEQAAKDRAELLKAKFATEVYPAGELGNLKTRKGGKFHALNQAIFDGGYTLHVPQGVKLADPYVAQFTTRPLSAGIFPHNLVVVEDGAEAVLIEKYVSEDPRWNGLSCPQTEIILGKNSKLHYILLQEVGQQGLHIGAHRVTLAQNARAIFASAHLGGKTSKTFMEVEMNEPQAHAVIYGLYYGLEQQKFHLDTWQHHVAPNCTSDLMFKGALDHGASAVYRGMIRLEPDAQKTDAYQQNRTLLLSDDASINSIPGLEILANDVRCTHGSTAGQIDPNMLFYLLSRGLTKFEASKMIMDGFFEEVIVKFGLDAVIEPLRKEIDAKIDANVRK